MPNDLSLIPVADIVYIDLTKLRKVLLLKIFAIITLFCTCVYSESAFNQPEWPTNYHNCCTAALDWENNKTWKGQINFSLSACITLVIFSFI